MICRHEEERNTQHKGWARNSSFLKERDRDGTSDLQTEKKAGQNANFHTERQADEPFHVFFKRGRKNEKRGRMKMG